MDLVLEKSLLENLQTIRLNEPDIKRFLAEYNLPPRKNTFAGITRVQNQLGRPLCVLFTVADLLSICFSVFGTVAEFSMDEMYKSWCDRSGGIDRFDCIDLGWALDYVKHYGLPLKRQPGARYKIFDKMVFTTNLKESISLALNYVPVIGGLYMDKDDQFLQWKEGSDPYEGPKSSEMLKVNPKTKKPEPPHAIIITGYNFFHSDPAKHYFICKNSHGRGRQNDGYINVATTAIFYAVAPLLTVDSVH